MSSVSSNHLMSGMGFVFLKSCVIDLLPEVMKNNQRALVINRWSVSANHSAVMEIG